MLFTDDLLRATPACVHFVDADEVDHLIADERLDQYWIEPSSERDALLLSVADVLPAPEYFGENWDALEELLGDLDEERAQVLLVRGARRLWSQTPRECGTLIETWLSVSESRANGAAGFHLVFIW